MTHQAPTPVTPTTRAATPRIIIIIRPTPTTWNPGSTRTATGSPTAWITAPLPPTPTNSTVTATAWAMRVTTASTPPTPTRLTPTVTEWAMPAQTKTNSTMRAKTTTATVCPQSTIIAPTCPTPTSSTAMATGWVTRATTAQIGRASCRERGENAV